MTGLMRKMSDKRDKEKEFQKYLEILHHRDKQLQRRLVMLHKEIEVMGVRREQ